MARLNRFVLGALSAMAMVLLPPGLRAQGSTEGFPPGQVIVTPDGIPTVLIQPVKHDVSPPMRDTPNTPNPPKPGVSMDKVDEYRRPIPGPKGLPDPVLQTENPANPSMPSPSVIFEGQGTGLAGFNMSGEPADTNGDVGPNHYVQIVNTMYAVFNKSGGIVQSPKNINTVWSGFGGGCQTNNNGDPVVKYDRRADRWIISQFSVTGTPYLQCIAVSTSGDPTGTYNRYSYSFGNTNFNDYPKLGIWPDAYYMTFNIFANGASFSGDEVCAFDRTTMLTGSFGTAVCKGPLVNDYSLLPADVDGPNDPPSGEPNFLVELGTSTSLDMYKFHVDFGTPANSTLTGPTSITVASYSDLCGGANCVTQPSTTLKLDSLADRLMYRLSYRNFPSDHESLLVDHSVVAGSGGGIRWYEIRSPNATPTLFQQGTFAPDSNFRWMGSIAMDGSGNMAAGYSVSSSANSVFPSIRWAGRLVSDPAGALSQGETQVFAGLGSQKTHTRWGDYSNMAVDPSDDCTFWFTTMYMPTGVNDFDWHSKIASFKYSSCGCTPPAAVITAPGAVCASSTGNIASVASAGGGATYVWTIAGGTITAGAGTTQITFTAGASGTVALGVTVTNATSCSANGSTNVTINPLPSAMITAPAAACAGSTGNTASVPNAGVGATYAWTIGGGTITSAANIQSITFTAGASGTVSLNVTVTTSSSCSANGSTNVTINPIPNSAITAATSVCGGSTGNVASVPETSATYAWTIASGTITSAANIQSITYTAGASGSISLTCIVTKSGCQSTGNKSVTINPLPSATITAPVGVCAGSTGNAASVPSAGVGATYAWTIAGGTITSAANIQSITFTAGASGTVSLNVTVTTSSNCAANGSTNVTINPLPSATITAPVGVCAGSTGNAASVPSAGGGATYAWTIGGGTITSAANIQSITFTAGASGTVSLNVTVTTSSTCSANGSTNVTINPLPSATISTPTGVCAGSTGNTASVPNAGVGATYAWTIAGGSITSATNIQSITFTAGSSGTVSLNVTVTTSSNCSTNGSTIITINPLPSATISAPTGVCAGSTGNTASVASAGGGATYLWTITNGTIAAGAGTTQVTFTAGASGTVALGVTVTNASACSANNSTNVTISPPPSQPAPSNNGPICAGQPLQLSTATVAGATYGWSGPNGFSSNLQNPSVPSASTLDSGTYTLVVTLGSCVSSPGTTSVTVNPLPVATASGSAAVCAGFSTLLSGSGGTGCAWTPAAGLDDANSCAPNASPGATTTYTLTVTDANGCLSAAPFQNGDFETGDLTSWTVDGNNNPPSIDNSNAHSGAFSVRLGNVDPEIEPTGDSALSQEFAVPPSGGTLSFWYWPSSSATILHNWQDAYMTDLDGTLLAVIMHVDENDQTWKNQTFDLTPYAGTAVRVRFLVHQDGSGNDTGMNIDDVSVPVSNQATVTVNPLPDATIAAPASVGANSAGNTASVPESGATYAWTIAGGTITSATNTQSITFTAGASGTVSLNVTVTTSSNCSADGSSSISIVPPGTVLRYFTIVPCRAIDTRNAAGAYGGPALAGDGATRDFLMTGECGIPSDAYAISINLTVINPTGMGDLGIFPTGIVSNTSAINFDAGRTRANNAIVPLTGTPAGSMTVRCDIPAGSTQFVVDVSGYFQFVSH